MVNWNYHYAGLNVASSLELPEWDEFLLPAAPDSHDVEIKASSTAVTYEHETSQVISADEFCLVLPPLGKYRVSNGNKIEIAYLHGVDLHKLRFFLLGSVWGALCYQRGMLAVHAGAVQIGDKAILFCGNQGKGKSTLTACMALRGHPLVSDDLCCLKIQDDGLPAVHPSNQRLRLWSAALLQLGLDKTDKVQDFFRFDKYLVPWHGIRLHEPIPLQAAYLLEWGEFKLEKLSGTQALQRFIAAATYRGEMLLQMGKSGQYWQQCLELIAKVPVWVLTRPHKLTTLDAVGELVENHSVHSEQSAIFINIKK